MSLRTSWLVGPAVHHTIVGMDAAAIDMSLDGNVHIHGIVLANNTDATATVHVKDSDGNTLITLRANNRDSVKSTFPFNVDNGLTLELIETPDTGIKVTLLHCGLMTAVVR